jgi:dolichol-phosphate mannosyltransferase
MTKKDLPKIVIIMPTYNEAENITRMVDVLFEEEFPRIKEAQMHLLVVDDNSPDGTGDIVKKKQMKYKNLHLLQGEKAGLGKAYVRGFKYAMQDLKADATLEMDSDFQHDPKHVKAMVQAFLSGADYVIGSRYIKGGSIPAGWAIYRKAISYFGNLYARLVLWLPKLHDTTTGFRLTRVKGVLNKIDLDNLMELHRFAFKVDLFYQSTKLSKNTVEVPIHFAQRTQEKSKFSLAEMVATYKVVMLLRLRASKKFIKFAIVGFLGFIVNFVFLRVFRSLGLGEVLVWLFATELAIINNYVLNNIWTFKEKKIGGIKKTINKFIQFNLTSAGALVIQSILGPLGVYFVGAKYDWLVLLLVVGFFVMPYNYFMYNAVIWKTWHLPGPLGKLQKL